MATSIALIKASDGSGNAAVATVQNSRTAGSSTIVVDTVAGINTTFMGSMGTPHTFVDPETAETITVISEATNVDFTGHVDGANLEIDDIAPGQTDLGSAVDDIIVIRPTTDWADNVAAVIGVSHNDDGTIKDNIVAVSNLASQLQLGWSVAGETWVYVSGTGTVTGVFKIVGVDLTSKYQAGDRFKFTQTQVKYGIATKVALVGSDTQVALLMSATSGTVDNSGMTNTTISANYYSRDKSPFGFPLAPERWTVSTTSSSARTNFGNNAWATLTDAITVPIGVWRFTLTGLIDISTSAQVSRHAFVTPSSDASTETNSNATVAVGITSASSTAVSVRSTCTSITQITLTSDTTFTLMGKLTSTTSTTAAVQGNTMTTTMRAVCAYL